MKTLDAFKLFIKTDNSIICCYNKKKSLITDFVYYEGDEFKEKNDYSLDEFHSFVNGFFGAEIDAKLIIKTVSDFLSQENQFDLPFIFKDKTGPVKFRFKGGRIDDDNLVVSIIKGQNKGSVNIDELTKCVSLEKIRNTASKFLKEKESFILGIVDIDNFSTFNQKCGSVLGDIVLIELASTLKSILRNDGIVSRVGGDSFVFIYKTDTSNYDYIRNFIFTMKETINDNINKVINIDDELTITIGLSRSIVDGEDLIILYNKAFSALERGKKKSRDCFIIYFEEKCGPVDSIDRINKVHYEESTTANYSAIAAVVEVLNSNLNFGRRIAETLNLVGTFFMLDRITLVEYDQTGNNIKEVKQWNNPITPQMGEYNPTIEEMLEIRKYLGVSNLYVANNIQSIENEKIKNCLIKSHTLALLVSELKLNGRYFGLIKFEMTSHSRVWRKENIMALDLLSKLISIKYAKEYDTYIHYMQMYFDKETSLYNYHRWYEDVSDFLEENRKTNTIKKFMVLDIGIQEHSALISIVGMKVFRSVLKAIAQTLIGLETEKIAYCRSYENRFTIFLPNDDKNVALEIFYKALASVDKIIGNDGEKAIIRAGYCVFNKDTDLTIDDIVERAAVARKKGNQNNNFVEFTEQMLMEDKYKNILLSHFEIALEKNEFLLYLQPKISTKTGIVAGAEALSRWNYNFERLIFPNDFISVLESNGYISRLDFKLFENVCLFIKKLEKNNLTIIPISVNVSRSIRDFDVYFNNLEQIRQKYDVDPKYLEIEITEGLYSLDNEAIEKFIYKLHKVGYSVSMDDFGSGNSNISTLSELTFDTIKFDKAFFKDIDNTKEKMIVESMIKLVKGMNLKVVCEGVETEEYVKYLTNINVDYIQGFYYDKPIPVELFEEKYLK